MSVTTYRIELSAPLYSAISLNVSSFNFSSNANSFTGSCTVEGHDMATDISNRITDGVITLYQTIDGIETEYFEADVDSIGISISDTTKKYTINFIDGTYSQSKYSVDMPIDSIISNASFSNSYWTFTSSDIDIRAQHGITVNYDAIGYYISDISVNYAGGSFGSMTLNEGEEVADIDDSSACYDTFSIGDTVSDSFSLTCAASKESMLNYLGYVDGYICYQYSSPPTFHLWGCYFRRYEFELTEEKNISIELSSALPVYSTESFNVWRNSSFTGDWYVATEYIGSKGLVCLISSGQYSEKEFRAKDTAFATLTAGETFTGTLPIGIYTVSLYCFSKWSDISADPTFELITSEV